MNVLNSDKSVCSGRVFACWSTLLALYTVWDSTGTFTKCHKRWVKLFTHDCPQPARYRTHMSPSISHRLPLKWPVSAHPLHPGSTWAIVGVRGDWPAALRASDSDDQFLLGTITNTLTVFPSPAPLGLLNVPLSLLISLVLSFSCY